MPNTTFIELTVNAFDTVFANRMGKKQIAKRGAGLDSVRRPMRGIEVKDDTYAVIRVVRANGEEIPLISSSYKGGRGPSYTNFILQSVSDPREEKVQIVETFGIPYVFFFGQRPHIIDVQAMLINTLDFNWEAEFWENYDKYLRGTKCVEMGARVYLFYDDNIVEGYMLKAQASKQAMDAGRQVPLAFTMLLTNYANVSMIESSTYPVRPSSMSAVYKGTPEADITYIQAAGIDAGSIPWLEPATASQSVVLENRTSLAALQREAPLRSDITDNTDEWTGDNQISTLDDDTFNRSNRFQQAAEAKLADQVFNEACKRGVAANNPGFLRGMGLLGGGAGAMIGAQVGAGFGFGSGVGAGAGAGFGVGAKAGAYAGAGAWSGAGIGPGGAWSGSGIGLSGSAGAGAGYYGGQGVGYNPYGSSMQGGGGAIGFYAGTGYYGPGQYGTPGYGSGTAPASLGYGGFSAGAGSYSGWSPGGGSSGSYSYGGQNSPGNMPVGPGYAGPVWMPSPNYQGYGVMAGYSAGAPQQVGYNPGAASFGAGVGFGAGLGLGTGAGGGYAGGAFYGGNGGYMPYATPGYATGGYGAGTASSQYYAGAYAGYDPKNGSYAGTYEGSPGNMQYTGTPPPNTTGPMPGTPGGGLFTTQSFPTQKPNAALPPGTTATPYGQVSPQDCKDRADFLKGGPG